MDSQVVLLICDLLADCELAALSTCSSELNAQWTDNAVYAPRYHQKFGPNKVVAIPGRAVILYRQVMVEVRKLQAKLDYWKECTSLTALQYFAQTTGRMPETSSHALLRGRIDIVEWIHSYGIRLSSVNFNYLFEQQSISAQVLRWLEANGELLPASCPRPLGNEQSYCFDRPTVINQGVINRLFRDLIGKFTADRLDAAGLLLSYGYRPENHLVYQSILNGTESVRELLVQYRCLPKIDPAMGLYIPDLRVIEFMVTHGTVFTLDHVAGALQKCAPEVAPLMLSTVKMDRPECCDRFVKCKNLEFLQKCAALGGYYSKVALVKTARHGDSSIFNWLAEDQKLTLTADLYEEALYDNAPSSRFWHRNTAPTKTMIINDQALDIVFCLLEHHIPMDPGMSRQLSERLLGNTFLPHISSPPRWDALRRLSTYGIKPKIYKGAVATKTCKDIKVDGVRTMLENGVYPFLVKTELACAVDEGRDDLVQLYAEYGVKLSRTTCIIHSKPI